MSKCVLLIRRLMAGAPDIALKCCRNIHWLLVSLKIDDVFRQIETYYPTET